MLVAGPGYGKTILLEQWAPRDDRVVAWYRARRSAADVAVVARGLVTAASEVLPGAGRRLLERLAVTENPEREAVLLAEMLAEDLRGWPEQAWLVIDDYQHLAVSPACERFVETVVSNAPVRLLLASRERPAWVPGRALLYGDVLEIPQTALAMSTEEAAEVLEGGRPELASGLLALAGGWPAVIGLAGMAPDVDEIDADLPETLYEFFADELYRGLDEPVATGLAILAAMPTVDRELASALLGTERAEQVCGDALTLGILDDRDGRLEFHPLAAAFLEQRVLVRGLVDLTHSNKVAADTYRARRDWDAAFDLADRRGCDTDLSELLRASLDELLNSSRFATLEVCVERVVRRVGETPLALLAQAELALRQGQHSAAQSIAERIAPNEDADQSIRFRAQLLAGRAAHVGSREAEALGFFRLALGLAGDDGERRRAKWGELTAAMALEQETAHVLLAELEREAGERPDPTDAVRTVDKRIALGLRFGSLESLSEARRIGELLPFVHDPFARCSFRSTFSCALNLGSEYELALRVASDLLREAQELRVDFALPYGSLMRGAALAGMRQFDDAYVALQQAHDDAVGCSDLFGQQGVYAGRVRALLHQARVSDACALEPPDLSGALPGMRGEVIASRGLALACIGRIAEARRLADETRTTTRGIEARILTLCIDAVCSVKARQPDQLELTAKMLSEAYTAGAPDLVVTTYRASPEILTMLLRGADTAEVAGYVVTRARDHALAAALGIDPVEAIDPISRLSPREREVYDMVCEGLTNRQIAQALFISEETVKAHLHHTYDKLGVRSRTALALGAAYRSQARLTAWAGSETTSDSD